MVAHLSGVNWANSDLPEFLKLKHFEMRDSEEGEGVRGTTCPRYWQEFPRKFKYKNYLLF